ncbi:MAG: hypothetical protein KatS3mg060_2614 [Dehalococcoidia bacterium]|nr:MAG: hypothetical protein KatS3mg060_2614 [Dehalococcoidia bacterium]
MTTSAAPLTTVIGALALGIAALALATSGDFFRSALLGIAAYLILNVLLWVAVQSWPAPTVPAPPRVTEVDDEPAELPDDDPVEPSGAPRPPKPADGGA